jgi:hypothetical protein
MTKVVYNFTSGILHSISGNFGFVGGANGEKNGNRNTRSF